MLNGKTRLKILTLVAAAGIATFTTIGGVRFFGETLSSAAPQEQKERLIHRLPVENGEPIVITDIKVSRQSISFDHKFLADDDWLKSLSFTIKNRSDKRILALSFMLWFPRPLGSQDIGSTFVMSYGNSEFHSRKPNPQERLIGMGPGQVANIQFSPEEFRDLQFFLSGLGYKTVEKVEFNINEVIFEDDTMWFGGRSFQRDKNNQWQKASSVGLNRAAALRFSSARASRQVHPRYFEGLVRRGISR